MMEISSVVRINNGPSVSTGASSFLIKFMLDEWEMSTITNVPGILLDYFGIAECVDTFPRLG